MIEQRNSRLSLRQVLTIPYVVLVLALALTIVALSYRAGSQAVDTVSSHLLRETVGRIGQAIDRHIVGSGAVLEAAFPDGMPVPSSIETEVNALRARFWIATSLHLDPNNYVYFGNPLGQGIGLYRLSRTEGELRIKLKAEEPRTFYRFTGVDGALTLQSNESKIFDPRTRPWYKAGENEAAHTWTSIYIDFVTEDLVATRARRVLGPKGEFQGVVATDVSLRALNDFVSNLKVSPRGLALIVEPNGNLIASSVGANVKVGADGVKARVSAAQSGNPLVAAIYSQIQQRLIQASQGGQSSHGGQAELLPGANTFNFTGPDGDVIHAGFDRIKDDAGLEWITAVAMPRSDFMSGVSDNVVNTALLSALAAFAAIAIGLRILTMLAADLKHLSNAALQVGDGQLNWQVGIKRPDEIGQLAKSFELMQHRLQTDELTSLANREAFMQRLRYKIGQAEKGIDAGRFAVLFIDLNRFKQINDTFGHAVGDKVLIEVGRRLKGTVRSQDLVARLSGDEFVVLLDRVNDREGLERVRVQIHLALKEPLAALTALNDAAAVAFDFGGSVGDALFPDDGVDSESLMKKADRRMYGQKFAVSDGGKGNPNRRFSDSMLSEFRG